jgi:auxin responsive GH3 family protein
VACDGTDVLAIHLHFFEFIPEGDITKNQYPVLTCDQLEEGKYYYIIFTASNGLYRYFINDIIYVSGFYKKTPVIRFAFKGGNVSSLTGEKIYENHVENALARAQRKIGATIVDFTAIPCLATPPFYRVAVEFAGPEQQGLKENLAREMDCELIKENISYRRMREARILEELVVTALPPGTFEAFIKFRIDAEGAPYSQIKIGHLNPGRSFLKFLDDHALL